MTLESFVGYSLGYERILQTILTELNATSAVEVNVFCSKSFVLNILRRNCRIAHIPFRFPLLASCESCKVKSGLVMISCGHDDWRYA